MIVVDASCLIEWLLDRPKGAAIDQRLFHTDVDPCAPSLIDVEVCHALRRLWLLKQLSASRAVEAIGDLRALRLVRFPHEELLEGMWRLRVNHSAYDATYVALAEALDAPLATCDKKLAAAVAGKVQVEVF